VRSQGSASGHLLKQYLAAAVRRHHKRFQNDENFAAGCAAKRSLRSMAFHSVIANTFVQASAANLLERVGWFLATMPWISMDVGKKKHRPMPPPAGQTRVKRGEGKWLWEGRKQNGIRTLSSRFFLVHNVRIYYSC
jgi:hypothetical protein